MYILRGKNPCLFSRWQLNGSDINLGMESRYELNRGDLVVINPHRDRDSGSYQCFATNALGTIVSREAKLQFACKCRTTPLQAQQLTARGCIGAAPWGSETTHGFMHVVSRLMRCKFYDLCIDWGPETQ